MEPTKALCGRWDESFVSIFETGLWFVLAAALLGGLIWGILFRRRFWIATAPYLRNLLTAVAVIVVATLVMILWPLSGHGLGRPPYSSLDPAYPDCRSLDVETYGFFGGIVGADTLAIGQPLTMLLLVIGFSLTGLAIATAVTFVGARIGWKGRRS